MSPDYTRRLRAFWFAGLMSFCLIGCSFISVDRHTRYRDAEGYFESTLLDAIKVGETSQSWLLAHFGRPSYSEVDALAGYPAEVQINTWRFEREQQKNTRVFLLYRSRNLDQQYEYLHVVSEGDKVMRAWRDASQTVDTPRLMAAMGYAKVRLEEEKPAVEIPAAPAAVQSVPPPASLNVEDVSQPAIPSDQAKLTGPVDSAAAR